MLTNPWVLKGNIMVVPFLHGEFPNTAGFCAAVPFAIPAEAVLAAVQSGGEMSRGENQSYSLICFKATVW